ncbi:MarR family transcriptional regulator [Microbispora hainanensis]|jgi:DNA-binding MarR family transcriptional regulator|uniref:MarR family transcriptional regulator n=1 Tax=Microbispora hainanensis TaxID=568844 RepID=A0ABZ1SV40_9ACTN|nr:MULTISPECIES: MarR family transcriptional regulator [Microbispora]NJP28651.1 MarR family transcriptional regulator [Microbispora sp. CL1-1]TQS07627.1 MarR family transcriptional regulator [Microbispora sp. SCL1-1]
MERNLSLNLHVLTARLDRAADRILRAEHDISYSRFLALTLVGELGASTQRTLAEYLGVTEPSVSRMTGVLAADGLLDVQPDPAGGNRRRLSLTDEGKRLVASIRQEFEDRLAAVVAESGVPYAEYAEHTARLLTTFDRLEREAGK